jgi:hypothetical protein
MSGKDRRRLRRETGLLLVLIQYLTGVFNELDVQEAVDAMSKSPRLREFLQEVFDYLFGLRGLQLAKPIWQDQKSSNSASLLDLLHKVLVGRVHLDEAHLVISDMTQDPLLFPFFVEVLLYLSSVRNLQMPAALCESMDKHFHGIPPLPRDSDEIAWLYRQESDKGGD